MKNKSNFSLYMFIITMFFFYVPLAVLVLYSFNSGKSLQWSGFSTKWYVQLFTVSTKGAESLWSAFGNSIIIALLSSFIATIIGTLGAYGLYWYNFRFKKYLQVITYLPLIMPEIIIGVAMLIFFAAIKTILPAGFITVLIAHITFSIPFVLFIVMSRLEEFDYSIIEAAYDLGARELDALIKVIIPVTIPGIISGFLMAMTLSLDDYVITYFVTGPGLSTLPLEIVTTINRGAGPLINTISVVLIILTIALTLITRNIQKYLFSK